MVWGGAVQESGKGTLSYKLRILYKQSIVVSGWENVIR